MPKFVINGETVEYADEAEVLDFANKVRAAGGGEPIEGLFPSEPSEPNACLIAKALNFGCNVDGWYPKGTTEPNKPQKGMRWVMYIDRSYDDVKAIADAVGCEMIPLGAGDYWRDGTEDEDHMPGFLLPELIGNAARAFDMATDGWVVEYRKTV